MTTPRKRTSTAVIELLKAAENALATAAVLQSQARTKRREIDVILEKITDINWIKKYPDTVEKATGKIRSLEETAATKDAEAETQVSEARRFLVAAQLVDRE